MEGSDGSIHAHLCGVGVGVQVNGKAATLQVGICRAVFHRHLLALEIRFTVEGERVLNRTQVESMNM